MDCAGCGDCCEVFWLPMSLPMVRAAVAMADAGRLGSEPVDARFIAEHMTPLDPQPQRPAPLATEPERPYTAWSCDMWDPESRLCKAHDERPDFCRGYPYYGKPVESLTAELLARCSHRWDLPPAARGPLVGRLLPLWPAT